MPNPAPANIGELINLQTNIHRLDILGKNNKVFRYDVAVHGIDTTDTGQEIPIDLTLHTDSDYFTAERRKICFAVFNAFVMRERNAIIGQGNPLFYDLERVLYALGEMKIAKEGKELDYTDKEVHEVDAGIPLDFKRYRFKITPMAGQQFCMTLGDLTQLDGNMELFLNICTAQDVFKRPIDFLNYSPSLFYLYKPGDYGFVGDDLPILNSNNAILGVGINKCVRQMQASMGLILEVIRSPFHKSDIYVSEKVEAVLGDVTNMQTAQMRQNMEKLLKGLCVLCYKDNLYHRVRFPIHSLTNNAESQMISTEGEATQSIFDFYKEQFNLELEYPHLPLVVHDDNGHFNFYPMEVCLVLDQRVSAQTKLTNSLPPAMTIALAEMLKKSIDLHESKYLDVAGVRFNNEPIKVCGRVLPPPELEFFGGHRVKKPELPHCNWRGLEYFMPATFGKWAAIAFTEYGQRSDETNTMTDEEWEKFVSLLQQKMTAKGIQFNKPTTQVLGISSNLEELMYLKQNAGIEFVLFAHPNAEDGVHDAMKYHERTTEIITQGLTISTVKEVLKERTQSMSSNTMDNIVNKMNCKLGGLNCLPIMNISHTELKPVDGDKTLVIGLALFSPIGWMNELGNDNPAQQSTSAKWTRQSAERPTAPAIVGFSANIGSHHWFEFIGDFYFQEPSSDIQGKIVKDIVKRCLEAFGAHGQYPHHMIIYRYGCQDEQFDGVLANEVPAMRDAMNELGCEVKTTFLAVNDKQAVRLFKQDINKQDTPEAQNIPPGTVVDTEIVHPKWPEFYLNSHVETKGTAITPRYTVLLDENAFPMVTLEVLTYQLCFDQIYSPISLPTPIFVALEYAKRGQNLFNFWANSVRTGGDESDVNYDELNGKLNYGATVFLKKYRLNA